MARISVTGALDNTFVPGLNLGAQVYALALQSDGNLLVGGSFTNCRIYSRYVALQIKAVELGLPAT